MSSKAARRRKAYEQRKKKRERAAKIASEHWTCPSCWESVPPWSPICLCGHVRNLEDNQQ